MMMRGAEPDTIAGLFAGMPAFGDRDMLVFPEGRRSFADVHLAASEWARLFIAMGIGRGDKIGLLMPTSPDFVDILLAANAIGAVLVPLNTRFQPAELAYTIANADVAVLVTTSEIDDVVDFADRLRRALPSLDGQAASSRLDLPEAPLLRQIVVVGGTSDPAFLTVEAAKALYPPVTQGALTQRVGEVEPSDIGVMLYTSGTTSNPKGCLVSQDALLFNTRNMAERYHIGTEDRLWAPLPIFHIAGILPVLIALRLGIPVSLMQQFNGPDALRLLVEERITCGWPCFVTILQDVIDAPGFDDADLTSVRILISNPAVVPPAVSEVLERRMPNMVQIGNFGMTESIGPCTASKPEEDRETRLARLGTPFPGWDIRIRDAETGQDLPVGEKGEIIFKSRGMISGYYKAPDKQAEAFTADGFLRSGDIGSFDEHGQIMFHGRLKDMMKVGGENVAAAEVEAVLNAHAAVKLAQVVPISHPRYQEVPAAFIQLNDGASATEEELIDFCRGKIANFKLPRAVRFIDAWPMSTSKIQKFRLREMAEEMINAR
jgi:acyl-CoA synthetase (AMP-forming)/AMP-acid ligase II